MRSWIGPGSRGRSLPLAVVALSVALVLNACGATMGGSGGGREYPSGAITLVIPFDTGGNSDSGGRRLAAALEEHWGTTVTVLNQPGGNTVPAVQNVMSSRPDGRTILLDTQPSSSMLNAAVPSLPFDATDRTFIATATASPMLFIVQADSPLQTLQDAAAFMRSNPTGFTWTSYGGAGSQDYAFRQLFRTIGVDVDQTRAVVSEGGDNPVTQIAGGHVDVGVSSFSSARPALEAGLVRVLAVAAPERFFALPDVPTTVEAGFPEVEVLTWLGFSGPPGLPADVVEAWNAALPVVLEKPAVVEGLQTFGITPFYKNAQEMKDFVMGEQADVNDIFGR